MHEYYTLFKVLSPVEHPKKKKKRLSEEITATLNTARTSVRGCFCHLTPAAPACIEKASTSVLCFYFGRGGT